MMKFRSCVLLFGLAAAGLAMAHGQAIPAAIQPGILTVGMDGSISTTDIYTGSENNLTGVGVFANYELGSHLSAAADVHLQEIVTPQDYGQNTYLIGLRYNLHYGRFEPYGKVMAGIGSSYTTEAYKFVVNTPGKYFAYALGGGVDIRIKGHWVAHVDGEQQFWPGFPSNGLTPVVGSIGLGYRFRP